MNYDGNEYAVMNLQTLKNNIYAYASFSPKHYELYDEIERAQEALQALIDKISG